jgi:hypothetical protein
LGNYGCFDGACVGISLTLSKYQALTNEQITATITINGFTSSMQGKTAYVLNTTVDKISDYCTKQCSYLYGEDYFRCYKGCFSYYLSYFAACNCTIDSTGSCFCSFNAPSNPGTYNYTGFVDLNGNYFSNFGEYDTKTLKVITCYKSCNTHDDCKGDFEKKLLLKWACCLL